MAKKKIKLASMLVIITTCVFALGLLSSCISNQSPQPSKDAQGLRHHDGYTLEQMTVVSRHQIRSALSEHGSDLAKINAHEWLPWTSSPSYLTDIGCAQEALMGQYFRTFFESEKFIPEN